MKIADSANAILLPGDMFYLLDDEFDAAAEELEDTLRFLGGDARRDDEEEDDLVN